MTLLKKKNLIVRCYTQVYIVERYMLCISQKSFLRSFPSFPFLSLP